MAYLGNKPSAFSESGLYHIQKMIAMGQVFGFMLPLVL